MDDPGFVEKRMPAKIVRGGSGAGLQTRMAGAFRIFLPAGRNSRVHMDFKIPSREKTPAMFSVYSDYEGDWPGEFTDTISSEVTKAGSIPDGLAVIRIPAQMYAVFTAAGPMPDAILGVWMSVWGTNLPRRNAFDFERFDARFNCPEK